MHRLKKLSLPYLIWMIVLVVAPSILILILSFSDLDIYNLGSFKFSLEHVRELNRPEIIVAVKNSIRLSFYATLACFVIGYPVAYYLANMKSKNKTLLVTLLIVPVWSNMILRIIAWEKLFYPKSILNDVFNLSLDLIGKDIAIIIGMVSLYLPFMVLPIYSVLEKMDKSLIEASKDLGANGFVTFKRVILPLSMSGVVSGTIMTLLPAMTAFALPERLSRGKTLLLGNIIEEYFVSSNKMNLGSLISIMLMGVIVIMFVAILKFDKEGETLI